MQTSDFLFSVPKGIYIHALWCYKTVIGAAEAPPPEAFLQTSAFAEPLFRRISEYHFHMKARISYPHRVPFPHSASCRSAGAIRGLSYADAHRPVSRSLRRHPKIPGF